MTGEQVTYVYDELERLASASTAGPAWGLSWSYDGFGNRLSQNLTKGTGPTNGTLVDVTCSPTLHQPILNNLAFRLIP